jgi:hypothetical protein
MVLTAAAEARKLRWLDDDNFEGIALSLSGEAGLALG